MDDLNVGGTTTIEPAVTETPEQSTGTEQAGAENQSTEGGQEQSQTDGSQQQTGARRKWTQLDQIKELRAERRELRERLSAFDDVRNELAQLREEMQRRNQPITAKTPANFWQDPEARLSALRDEMKEAVAEQNQELMQAFHRTREEEYTRQEQVQKSADAAEFIRSQQGYDKSDEEDIIEIIKEIPKNTRDNSEPQMIAEYAWLKLKAQRGITDKGLQKRQAAGIQGQPPGVGFGRKQWNKAEFDQAVDLVEKNPLDPKMADLFNELQAAHKEGRVK